jgi:hypothetical protein
LRSILLTHRLVSHRINAPLGGGFVPRVPFRVVKLIFDVLPCF